MSIDPLLSVEVIFIRSYTTLVKMCSQEKTNNCTLNFIRDINEDFHLPLLEGTKLDVSQERKLLNYLRSYS